MQEFMPIPEQETIVRAERIEKGNWVPGVFEQFSDHIGVGSTTKLSEQRAPGAGHTPRLRIVADAKRIIEDRGALEEALAASGSKKSVEEYRGQKVAAGLQLVRLLRELDPDADAHSMLKTRLAHGTDIVIVDDAYLAQSKEKLASIQADGIITQCKHVPIMVAAADCAPVAVFDPTTQTLGLFHAGYKGTEAQMSTKMIQTMVQKFGCKAENLRVVVGPLADGERFGIHKDVRTRMLSAKNADGELRYSQQEIDQIFRSHPTDPNAFLFDNGEAVRIELLHAGIPENQIEVSGYSTMGNNELFSSERIEGAEARDTMMVMAVLK